MANLWEIWQVHLDILNLVKKLFEFANTDNYHICTMTETSLPTFQNNGSVLNFCIFIDCQTSLISIAKIVHLYMYIHATDDLYLLKIIH